MPAKGVLLAEIADVVVAGGGVIGTAIAWRAAAAGLDVVLVDPADGQAASLVAAGMLAPASEALFGEGALLRLNLLAVRRFGSFAARAASPSAAAYRRLSTEQSPANRTPPCTSGVRNGSSLRQARLSSSSASSPAERRKAVSRISAA